MPDIIVVPVELANRVLAILGQLPYIQVADVVNELRSIEITESPNGGPPDE